ncbi:MULTISPECIES: orotate phosphoribosyltransferase [unclassified Mucilaginibacter]|uniref:orotate phosphoribosyltransferase n=1 Tax=unclassified Mucilaginibacter TaxID=2617802 RepID=UPI000960F7EE|nr:MULTISPECIES: orotate phosphoribosyltransferase [unclassified Mucilaginibacter]OJW18267.1 MAG: orotate phosphoribosyltransferase [Mucilaginibacter sp. 44-25]PLW88981.1 MAG: orotate phosphoribosyltransferase [Mucilaginibacter sp.]PMP66126.1 MAG: orotate phosphoribosyltransferase [Mucilaginibacter sp.]HEK21182.1 orotate phosphoribosyltransferase [Bacteroidota bacterium]
MFTNSETEQQVAEFLLQIKAIKLQPTNPFTWASGWKSPIYCDNRVTLSYPTIRTYIRQKLTSAIQEMFGSVGCIAGVATAGIPQGALVAQELGLPFIYVRAKAKEHGRGNLIEGEINPGQRVVVIEDLISTGKSSLQAVDALREAGYTVAGLAAIFSYGFNVADENFKNAKCPYFTLSNYNALIKYAEEKQFISSADVDMLRKWREEPSIWGQ